MADLLGLVQKLSCPLGTLNQKVNLLGCHDEKWLPKEGNQKVKRSNRFGKVSGWGRRNSLGKYQGTP